MSKTKSITLFLLAFILLTGCFTSNKIQRIVAIHKLPSIPANENVSALKISFEDQDSVPGINTITKTTKNKDYVAVVPFVSWHKRDYDCQVGSAVYENELRNNIKESIIVEADGLLDSGISHSYDLKLGILGVGFDFNYFNKGGMVGIPPSFSITWKDELCRQTRLYLKLSYNLFEDGKSITTGEIDRQELIDTIYKYTPISTYDPSSISTSPEYSNLNGGVFGLINEEMTIGLVAFNDNIRLLSRELIETRLKRYIK